MTTERNQSSEVHCQGKNQKNRASDFKFNSNQAIQIVAAIYSIGFMTHY